MSPEKKSTRKTVSKTASENPPVDEITGSDQTVESGGQEVPSEQPTRGGRGDVQVLSQEVIDPASQDIVDRAVQFINEKANQTVYTGSLAIGNYVLKYFYGDDIEAATSRNPKKPASYRALCEHPNLSLKPEALGVMVRVAAQERFFTDNDVETERLSYSHKAELVKIPNDEAKINLVKELLKKSLSVRQLSQQVSKVREKPESEKPLLGTHLEKIIYSPEKLFEDSGRESLFHDGERRKRYLRSLKGKTRRRILSRLSDAVEKAREWVELYEGMKRDLEEIELERESKTH